MGRTAGPFIAPPFPNLQISPLSAVPKKRTEKLRVIHDLSYPRGSVKHSVNSRLLQVQCVYVRFEAVLQTISAIGPSCLLAKIDIKDAFRLLRVDPKDHYNLGMKILGLYLYELCIPFGISPGPAFFEEFATVIEKILNSQGITRIPHYADDSLLITTPEEAHQQYTKALSIFKLLGIPFSEDKLIPPSPIVEFLGIIIDCPKQQIRIPDDKLVTYRSSIAQAVANPNNMSLHDIQSLIGILIYSSRCVNRGRLFLSYLLKELKEIYPSLNITDNPNLSDNISDSPYNPNLSDNLSDSPHNQRPPHPHAIHGEGPLSSHRRRPLSVGSLMELRWWDRCLQEWNGVSILPPSISLVPLHQRHTIYTDACGTGMGAFLRKSDGSSLYLLHRWTDREINRSIRTSKKSMPFLEMLAVIRSVFTWQNELAESAIIIHSDCQPVVQAINSDFSSTLPNHHLLLSLFLITTTKRIFIDCHHIQGILNVEADALSRAPHQSNTHPFDSYMHSNFFSLSSVSSLLPNRIHQTPITDYPLESLEYVWRAFDTTPWQPPPIRHTNAESKTS
jgi:hypothetical protein